MAAKESRFQADLIKLLKARYPGCVVMKNDSAYIQGIPDILILYKSKWAALECKRDQSSHHQPNQDYYIEKMNDMSYAAFVYPENRDEVLRELDRIFSN